MPEPDLAPGRNRAGAEAATSIKDEALWRWSLYPFLFSFYPVLFLYLRNIREVRLVQVFWAAVISFAIAVACWFLTRLLSRQRSKRSLLLFLFLLLFHFYGLYYAQISGLLPQTSRPLQAHILAFILPGTTWLVLTILAMRSRRSFSSLNRILQAAVLLLLAWNIGGIAIHHARSLLDHTRERGPEKQRLPAERALTPDIYCFVLDEFASPESARSLFGYDNGDFIAALRRLGFFVAEQSRSLYAMTEPAIAAILNLGVFSNRENPFPRIRHNAVAAALKNRGYRVIEFASLNTLFMDAADQRIYYHLVHASIFFDDFYRALFERSLLRILPDLWQLEKADLLRYYRARILQVFEELPAIVKIPGPKFVYVHLFSPHEPFVFGKRGEPVDPGHIWNHTDPRYYLGQYIYVSRRILETAAMILADSPAPPVIIMQSDHGYRGSYRLGNESKPISPAEMVRVFNALYLPGIPLDRIPPALSPLNNFRLVFNSYFGTNYPLLQNP